MNMDVFEINELPIIQDVISYAVLVENKKVIPADIMLGFYI